MGFSGVPIWLVRHVTVLDFGVLSSHLETCFDLVTCSVKFQDSSFILRTLIRNFWSPFLVDDKLIVTEYLRLLFLNKFTFCLDNSSTWRNTQDFWPIMIVEKVATHTSWILVITTALFCDNSWVWLIYIVIYFVNWNLLTTLEIFRDYQFIDCECLINFLNNIIFILLIYKLYNIVNSLDFVYFMHWIFDEKLLAHVVLWVIVS